MVQFGAEMVPVVQPRISQNNIRAARLVGLHGSHGWGLNRSERGWRGQKSEISDQRAAVFVELRRAREVSVVGVRFSQIYSDLVRFG